MLFRAVKGEVRLPAFLFPGLKASTRGWKVAGSIPEATKDRRADGVEAG